MRLRRFDISVLSNIYIFVYILLLTLSFSDRSIINYDIVKYLCFPYLIVGFVNWFGNTRRRECHKFVRQSFHWQLVLCVYAILINVLYGVGSIPTSMLLTVLTGFLLVYALTNIQVRLVFLAVFLGGFLIACNIAINGITVVTEEQNANAIGHVIYLSFFCGMLIFVHLRKLRRKVLIGGGLMIMLYTTFLLGSRQTFLICVMTLLMFVFFMYGRLKTLALIVLVLFVVYVLVGEQILSGFVDSYLYNRLTDNDDDSRFWLIQHALQLFEKRPIFGYGFGMFEKYSHFVYTHNTPTELLFSGGVIAFVLYYFVYMKLACVYFVKSLKNGDNSHVANVIVFVINIIFIVAGQFFIMFNSSLAYILYFQILNRYLLKGDVEK